MKVEQYPSTYIAADAAAASAQVAHFRLLKMELMLLFATAAIASITWVSFFGGTTLPAVAIALIFLLLMATGFVRYARRYDRRWFRSRAIAESVQVETWRLM